MGSVVVLEEFTLIQTRRWIAYRWSTHTFSHHRLYTLYTVEKRKTDVLCLRSCIGGYMGASSEHRNAIIFTLTAVIVHTCLKLT